MATLSLQSSYQPKALHYGHLLRGLALAVQPRYVVEFGILNGFSLQHLAEGAGADTVLEAFDLFDQFNGNHSHRETLEAQFSDDPRIRWQAGDFYQAVERFADDSIDLLHVDIANHGGVYEFALTHYWPKVKRGGLLCLEGGSAERDQVYWMKKYDKPPIQPVLQRYADRKPQVFEPMPSLTVFAKPV